VGLSTTTFFGYFRGYFFGNFSREKASQHCLQSAHTDQQESRAVAGKPHDAVVKFDPSRNLRNARF